MREAKTFTAGMTLEQRAEWVASISVLMPGGHRWRQLRDRALAALREHDAELRASLANG